MLKEYKGVVEAELDGFCTESLMLLDKLTKATLGNKDHLEARVFYMKMKGDYNRYACEFKQGQ